MPFKCTLLEPGEISFRFGCLYASTLIQCDTVWLANWNMILLDILHKCLRYGFIFLLITKCIVCCLTQNSYIKMHKMFLWIEWIMMTFAEKTCSSHVMWYWLQYDEYLQNHPVVMRCNLTDSKIPMKMLFIFVERPVIIEIIQLYEIYQLTVDTIICKIYLYDEQWT